MAKAFQDTNHNIEGFDFFLKKMYSQYTRNIHISILHFFDNTNAKKKLQYLHYHAIVLKHIIRSKNQCSKLFKTERPFRLIKVVTLPQSFEDDKTFFRQKPSIDTLSPE